MKKINLFFIKIMMLLAFSFMHLSAQAKADGGSLELEYTRVVYNGESNGVGFKIKNNGEEPYLMQSRVTNYELYATSVAKKNAPFIVTPPLKRLDPDEDMTIRIILTSSTLPQDKESLFLLILKAIPSSKSSSPENKSMHVALQNQLKLFYRPEKLPYYNAEQVSDSLVFQYINGFLQVQNPTPFWVTFDSLELGNKKIPTDKMIPPYGKENYVVDKNVNSYLLKWQLVGDLGIRTKTKIKNLSSTN